MQRGIFPFFQRIHGWRLNGLIVLGTVLIADGVVLLVERLLIGTARPNTLAISTASSLVIATLVVSWVARLRTLLADARGAVLEADIERARDHLSFAVEASKMVFWELELAEKKFRFDHGKLAWLGLAIDLKVEAFGDWLALVHPDDQGPLMQRFHAALEPGADPFDFEYRVGQSVGGWGWVHTLGRVRHRDSQGRPTLVVGGTLNISRHKLAERVALESRERLAVIFNDNLNPMLITRQDDGSITEVNEAFVAITGHAREHAIGNTTLGLGLWCQAGDRQRVVQALAATGRCENLETVFYTATGRRMMGALDAAITSMQGVPHIICTVRDISQRLRAETELKDSEALLRTTLSATDEGILMVGQDGRVLSANQRFRELWQLPGDLAETGRDELLLAHVLEQLCDPGVFMQQVQRLYLSDEEARDVLHFKDGRVFARFTRAIELGAQRARIWCFKDISDQVRAQEELATSMRLFQAVIDTSPIRIFWKDSDSRYLGCNPIFARDAGLNCADDLIGKLDHDLNWHAHASTYQAHDQEVMRSGNPRLSYEESQTTPQGGSIWVSTSKVPLHRSDGALIGVLGMYEDITERKRAEQALRASEAMLRAIFETASVGISICDSDGNYRMFNRRWAQGLGFEVEEMALLNYEQVTHPEDLDAARRNFQQMVDGRLESYRVEKRYVRKDQSVIWADLSVVAIRGSAEQLDGVLGVLVDITDRKRTELALKDSEFLWKFAIEGAGDGVWDWNIQTHEVRYSLAWKQMLGYSDEEILPTNDEWVARIHPEDQACVAATMQAYLDGEAEIYVVEYRLRCKDDGYKWILGRGMIVQRDAGGRPMRMIGTHADISQRKLAEGEIHQLAFHDMLTNLPNRRLLIDRLGQALAANRRSGCHGALMFIDLDNFKPLNDLRGHSVGDLLLVEVATRLSACVRAADTVARFGGDEFVVLLGDLDEEELGSTEQAGLVAEKIRLSLSQPYLLYVGLDGGPQLGVQHHCSASMGVAVFSGHVARADDVLRWADAAMYQAKEGGRNSVRFHVAQWAQELDAFGSVDAAVAVFP